MRLIDKLCINLVELLRKIGGFKLTLQENFLQIEIHNFFTCKSSSGAKLKKFNPKLAKTQETKSYKFKRKKEIFMIFIFPLLSCYCFFYCLLK